MILVRIIRWFVGSVQFFMTGAFAERLINYCSRKGPTLWDVTPHADGYHATTKARDYAKLHAATRATHTRVRLCKKRGLPFLLWRYRRRWGTLGGIAIAALLVVLLSTRIWIVEIAGCEKLDPQLIKAQLAELGFVPGIAAKGQDILTFERRMLLMNNQISWISINLEGSIATVEISERVFPPERLDPKQQTAHVIASHDGQIKYLEVYNGQPLVALGDTVRQGDIIVSGIMIDKHENQRLAYARAKVVARVQTTLAVSVLLEDGMTDESAAKAKAEESLQKLQEALTILQLISRDSSGEVLDNAYHARCQLVYETDIAQSLPFSAPEIEPVFLQ